MGKIDKKFFNYEPIAKEMWWDLVKEAQDRTGIHFDSENNEPYSQRKIAIETPEDAYETSDNDFVNETMRCNVELRGAGGDWEYPVYFFECQVYKSGGKAFHTDECFVLIPDVNQGNSHLVPGDKDDTWGSPDSNNDDVEKDEESVCWEALPEMLRKYKDEVTVEKEEKYPEELGSKQASELINIARLLLRLE